MPTLIDKCCGDCERRPTECERLCESKEVARVFFGPSPIDCDECPLHPEDYCEICFTEEEGIYACEFCDEEFEGEFACSQHECECEENPDNIRDDPFLNLDTERRSCGTCTFFEDASRRFYSECPHGSGRFDCDAWTVAREYLHLTARLPVPGQFPLPLGGICQA